MTNQDYARTIRTIAANGAQAMYSGPIAQAIVNKAQQSVGDDAAKTPITPSLMTLNDLSNYQAKKRDAICLRIVASITYVPCHRRRQEGLQWLRRWEF